MLPKRLRLRWREDFERLFRSGKALFEPNAGVFFKKSELAVTRVGFTFKQKVFPRATQRHFLKRKASDAVTDLQNELPQGMDIVFLFNKPLVAPTYAMVKSIVERLIQRINKEKK